MISFRANVCLLSRSALVHGGAIRLPAISGYQLCNKGSIVAKLFSSHKISTPVLLETHKFIRMS